MKLYNGENRLVIGQDAEWERWNQRGLEAAFEQEADILSPCVLMQRECNSCGQCGPKVEE